jgi:transaldolase
MSLRSLIDSGTKVWLDSIDPELVGRFRAQGATGATSNPIIIADLIKTGRFDRQLAELIVQGKDDETIAWELTDQLVSAAQDVFWPVWQETHGDDGYVSFELDPLIEDTAHPLPHAQRVRRYVELAGRWAAGHMNRLIKIPATPAGLDALEEVAAAGTPINVTLIFGERQYLNARAAIWRGAQRRLDGLDHFKSVYSIFVSRIDVYAERQLAQLSPVALGQVAILNAKEIWRANQGFWRDKRLRLRQEIVFASTGKKLAWQAEDYYAEALAGSDIETNPPGTNEAILRSEKTYARQVDWLPPQAIQDEIHSLLDAAHMETTLMAEGTAKFAEPQLALLGLIAAKRAQLTAQA